MKITFHAFGFFCLLVFFWQLSCSKEHKPRNESQKEFAIYLSRDSLTFDHKTDYSEIELDTVPLQSTPLITLSNIESYDTANKTIRLNTSKNELNFPEVGVFGRMFVVTVNNEPVYCGFFWSMMSSLICSWIYVDEWRVPFEDQEYKMILRAGYPDNSFFKGKDPRNDPRIIEAFRQHSMISN